MQTNRKTEVIGVASGKGGVGKTTVSINLSVALAQRGAKVMLFDADLGLANAQIALGARAPYNLAIFCRVRNRWTTLPSPRARGFVSFPAHRACKSWPH